MKKITRILAVLSLVAGICTIGFSMVGKEHAKGNVVRSGYVNSNGVFVETHRGTMGGNSQLATDMKATNTTGIVVLVLGGVLLVGSCAIKEENN